MGSQQQGDDTKKGETKQAQPLSTLRIALAQLNPVMGDIKGNAEKARSVFLRQAALGADLVVLPELFITGYPPEDLVLKPALQQAAMAAVEQLAKLTENTKSGLLIGTPWVVPAEKDTARKLHNAVALLENGKISALRYKVDLPNYGVFDEKRVFDAGPMPEPVIFRGVRLGVPICEDIWTPAITESLSKTQGGVDLFIVINGSPFSPSKHLERLSLAEKNVRQSQRPLIYVNQIGGQDELVFDGASFVLAGDETVAVQMPAWREKTSLTTWHKSGPGWQCEQGPQEPLQEGLAARYQACVLGLRDYVQKNSFPGVVLGLSGGIDSSLVAVMAVDALGADKVHCIMMPYTYTSKDSLKDAGDCASALNVPYDTIPIFAPVEAMNKALSDVFCGSKADVTEENIQSRMRGAILMAVSNKQGAMVLTTGNKSEMSVGYATLYGDMNGGFNPIKDLYKTKVFDLCRWRNTHHLPEFLGPKGEVVPQNIIEKPPTAELRENQTDQDSLPPYAVLDDILECLVEHDMPEKDIAERGHDKEVVQRVAHLLYISEYKRRQAAPGVKLTARNFGRDRRYPITNRFREKL